MQTDVIGVWRSQMAAGADIEKALSYFDQECEWKLVTSKKTYRGHREIRHFIQSGFSAAIIREEPDVVAEFASDEWGVFEYISRGRIGKNAVKFSSEIEQPENIVARLGKFVQEKLFPLLFEGKAFEVPVCFLYHVNGKGLIDQVHEYAATRR